MVYEKIIYKMRNFWLGMFVAIVILGSIRMMRYGIVHTMSYTD